MSYAMRVGENASDALRRVADDTLAGGLAAIDAAREGRGCTHRAVHDTRKACKSVRALLRLFRPGLGRRYGAENVAIREAARELAGWRDRRVLTQTCASLAEQTVDLTAPALRAVADEALGIEPPVPMHEALQRSAERLAAVRRRIADWRVRHPRRSAALGAAEIYRRGDRTRRRCRLDGPADPWHEWRKWVKHHAQHARFLGSLHPNALAYVDQLDALGKLLGEEHDLAVLIDRLGEPPLAGLANAEIAVLVARRRSATLRRQAAKVGKPLYRIRPSLVSATVAGLLNPKR